ncbi:hypothetical protein GCM10023192_36240 [Amycolatopsis samaneae]
MLKDAFGALSALKASFSAPNALKASFSTPPRPPRRPERPVRDAAAHFRHLPGTAKVRECHIEGL